MRIKFLTLNIYHGFFIDKVVSFIKQTQADIVCLQEVYNSQAETAPLNFQALNILKKTLDYPHLSFSPFFAVKSDGLVIPNGNLILSKFPIIASSFAIFDNKYQVFDFDGWFDRKDYRFVPKGIQQAHVKVGNKTINICNIHGPWGFDGADNPQRLKALSILQQKLKNRQSIILAGDFNLYPNTTFVKTLEQKLVNVFKNKLTTTFNIKRKPQSGNWANSVVDMIFVSRDIKIIEKLQPLVDVSDHLPLTGLFETEPNSIAINDQNSASQS
ncbi:MAG: endonuclease/exonuclease/phosphatase family protein [bacterium]|nr:endonuclease/exonuclease/phosphatase family protein [bacterium]